MDAEDSAAKNYLFELYTRSGGDSSVQVSMYDVGLAVGLEKEAARLQAEELIVEGWAELLSLSGGIAITAEGLKALDIGTDAGNADDAPRLGGDTELNDRGRQAVEELIERFKASLPAGTGSYQQLESAVIDIKTIEVQLLRSRPRTAIIREALRSLAETAGSLGLDTLAARAELTISG